MSTFNYSIMNISSKIILFMNIKCFNFSLKFRPNKNNNYLKLGLIFDYNINIFRRL